MSILKKVGFTMQLFWIPLLIHGMMLAVSANLIKRGLIPYSMVEWRSALLLSLLILSVMVFQLSKQSRKISVRVAIILPVPWLLWFAGSLLYAFVQWRITFLPTDFFLYAIYASYLIPFWSGVIGFIECKTD